MPILGDIYLNPRRSVLGRHCCCQKLILLLLHIIYSQFHKTSADMFGIIGITGISGRVFFWTGLQTWITGRSNKLTSQVNKEAQSKLMNNWRYKLNKNENTSLGETDSLLWDSAFIGYVIMQILLQCHSLCIHGILWRLAQVSFWLILACIPLGGSDWATAMKIHENRSTLCLVSSTAGTAIVSEQLRGDETGFLKKGILIQGWNTLFHRVTFFRLKPWKRNE